MRPIKELKNKYSGEDIYVLGAGPSLNFVNPAFFNNKIAIGINNIYRFFPVIYSVFKHKQFIAEALGFKQVVIASKHDDGDTRAPITEVPEGCYTFTHKQGRFVELEKNFTENLAAVGKDDDIFVSFSTITSGIHLAAYMGAKTIILCGHDCGTLDGKMCVDRYDEFRRVPENITKDEYETSFKIWLGMLGKETIRLKEKIKEVYGCEVYSLNPFINFALEGHIYEGCK